MHLRPLGLPLETVGSTMPLPFLHRFLASVVRSRPGTQPQSESQHAWPLSLVGPDGPQLLTFTVVGMGEFAPARPGIFIYARQRRGEWQALYIGESGNLAARLSFNEIAADALLSGATDIHLLELSGDAKARRDLTERLIVTNRPPLNEEERVHLKLPERDQARPAKGKTRAA